jgi:hypothetical protein
VGGLIEEDFSRSTIDVPAGPGFTRLDATLFTQRYRLDVSQQAYPNLRIAGGGMLEDVRGGTTGSGGHVDQGYLNTNLYGNLVLSSESLTGGAGYTRRQNGVPGADLSYVNEGPFLNLSWRPADLPALSLQLFRTDAHDTTRQLQNEVTTTAILGALYAPVKTVQLRYTLTYNDLEARLGRTADLLTVLQTGGANYAATFAAWRTAVSAGVNATVQDNVIGSSASGATVSVPVLFQAALSAIEAFPATPTHISLLPNLALGDKDLIAPSTVNLGYSATLAGDVANRHLAIQLFDETTPVNTIFVWVDRPVPQDSAATLSWTVYSSNNNLDWTPVALTGPPIASPLQNRFEISFARTAARFVKVVVKPLPGVTTDQRLANLFVTELQAYLVSPAATTVTRQHSNSAAVTASVRTQLANRDDLAYDATANLLQSVQSDLRTYNYFFAQGLSYAQKFDPWIVNARLAMQDTRQTTGTQSDILWNASASIDELRTLGHTLMYSGQLTRSPTGVATNNTVSLFNRATPYQGIAFALGFSGAYVAAATGTTTRTLTAIANTTLQPHRTLTITGAWGVNQTIMSGPGVSAPGGWDQNAEGTISFAPIPALYLSGGVHHTVTLGRGFTLWNTAVAASPFPEGALRATFSYSETLDSNGFMTRIVSPALRWNVTRTAVLSATYALIDNVGGPDASHVRSLDLNLKIPL